MSRCFILSYRTDVIRYRENYCEIKDCIIRNFMNEKRISRFSDTVAFCYSNITIEELYKEFRKMLSVDCPELELSEIRICVLPIEREELSKIQDTGNEYIGNTNFPW